MGMNKTGGPAFPIWTDSDGIASNYGGMTMRDYFAAKVMQGIMADPSVVDWNQAITIAPRQAYEMADAMLKARAE